MFRLLTRAALLCGAPEFYDFVELLSCGTDTRERLVLSSVENSALSMNGMTFSFERFSLPMNRTTFPLRQFSLPMNRTRFSFERFSLTPALSRWERENYRQMVWYDE
jgi:hypothetical protein